MKYLSLFSGIGGFELAIHANFPKAQCVGFSEIDKHAINIYKRHFPSHQNLGDIESLCYDIDIFTGERTINEFNIEMLPDFDLLVGGSPCQDLSIAKNNREGLAGPRSRLFFCFLEILRIKKPKYFLLENVASMSSDARDTITDLISKAYGRHVGPMEINSALVSAQNRRRLYWFPWWIDVPKDRGVLLKDIFGTPVHAWSKSVRRDGSFDERIKVEGKANSLTCSIYGTESINFFPDKVLDFKPRKVWSRSELFYHTIRKTTEFVDRDKAHCLDANYAKGTSEERYRLKNRRQIVYEDTSKGYRMLTPEECEFLQTFPKGYTEGVSRSQRYKCLGNAVTVEVIKEILGGLT